MNRFRMMAVAAGLALAAVVTPSAQPAPARALSAVGTASTEVGGKWIDLTYGRPRLRYRANIFGSGADYGKAILAGAPIWRAGANVSTRIKTDVALMIGGKHVMPGEYSIFIDAKEGNWTFVLSSWAAQQKFDKADKTALWGAYGYTPEKDVVRAPMTLSTLPNTVEELTWSFVDMTDKGGKLAIMWDKTMATVAFTAM